MSIGNFRANFINRFTGRSVQYAPETIAAKDVDGVLRVQLSDGLTYRSVGALGHRNRVNVLELGLVGDGVFDNSAKLRAAMDRLPKFTTFFFPAGTYFFGPLPAKYNIYGTPVAIYPGDTGANFYGESQEVTQLVFAPSCIGLQITGGQAPGITKIFDLTMVGPGQFTPTAYTGGQMKYNLLNGWGQFHAHNVNWTGAADGNNVCIYGIPEAYLPLPAFSVSGTLQPFADGRQGFEFYSDNATDLQVPFYESRININGVDYKCTSQGGGYLYTVEAHASYPPAGHYTLSIGITAGALIADNSRIDGQWNSDFATDCGIYIVGSDGNQTNIIGGSVRENGNWGIDDWSFLGTNIVGTHGSRNGKRFNRLGIDNIFGNDSLTVGSFRVMLDTAASVLTCVYSEQGNQGQDYLGASAFSMGGLHGNGVTGPGTAFGLGGVNKLRFGEHAILSDGVLELYHQATPDVAVAGTFTSASRNGATEILFQPQDQSQVALATVGQTFTAYGNPKTVTSVVATGWTLGPLTNYYPPSSPTTTPTTGYLTTLVKRDVSVPLRLREQASGRFGMDHNGSSLFELDEVNGGVIAPRLNAAGVVYAQADSLTAHLAAQLPYTSIRPGSLVNLTRSYGPVTYRCIRGGTIAPALTGITATTSGSNLITTVAPPQSIGYFYSYGGNTYEMAGYTGSDRTIYVLPTPISGTNLPFTFATPEFAPEGYGRGTQAQRLTTAGYLTATDAGWKFYQTDSTPGYWTWTGSAWVAG